MNTKTVFRHLLFSLVLAAAVLFPSCVKPADKTATELRYGFTSEPTTLDPLSPANTADGRIILFNVFEGLVKPDTEGRMRPAIAESWTVEQDGLVYNFKLRENVLFHDGAALTAADVKFSLENAVEAKISGLNQIDSVVVSPDNGGISVILKSPDPDFLPYLTVGIVRDGNNDRERTRIGTGPFFIESYTRQQNLVLKKFEGYWNKDLPHLEKVTIVFFGNNDAQMVALRGGSIDGASITGSMAAQLDPKFFDVVNSYSAAVQLLALNNAASPLDDLRVRAALNYGINITDIINMAFFGVGTPSGSPLIPGLSVYYESDLTYSYQPDTARSLLSRAGFGEGNRLPLEITVPGNYTMHVDTAQVIVNQLALIGVDASIKLVDWNTWLSEVYTGRRYQATIISLDSPNVSARSFLSRYRTGASGNFINFSSAEFDRVYDSVLNETDNSNRIRLYREAQRIVAQNAASVFIQDILYFKAFRHGAYDGVLNYPLYVIDFASIYGIKKN
jgi:peptide/nickel transport system substrate-binding protein